ncbi:AraC family transcriptional regulator [Phytomonospora sp. NPDC050363]|uniref:AraC family transcriptional regulator n=1 Tax=Phytomonospora sp. NPDC050363 TaxID=3155642 RepID=UPI0033D8187A
MDVLSDAITAMRSGRPHSALQRRRGPWADEFPASDGAGFHVLLQGACWFRPLDGEAVLLGAGDAVFLPREPGHRLESASVSEAVLLCGAYQLGGARAHPLWTALPAHMHIPARIANPTPMRAAIDLLGTELAGPTPGSGAMIPALLDALLVCMLRHWIDTAPEESGHGWAAAMRDPAMVSALTAVHEDPARGWTVAGLARRAGMSRSVLSERFTQMVGVPPMAYVAWWRMTLAAKRLRESDASVAGVARQVGYSSEFAFAKAFKRELGVAPGAYRRAGRLEGTARGCAGSRPSPRRGR